MAAARGPDSLYRRALPQGVRRQAQAKRESRRAGAPRLRWRSERQATQRSLTWRQYRILATAESMVAGPAGVLVWDSNPQGLTPGDVRDLCVYRFRHTSTV